MLVTKSNSAASAAILTIVMLTAFIVTIDGCSRSEDPGKLTYNFNSKSSRRFISIIPSTILDFSFFSIVDCEWGPWEMKDYDYPGPRLDGSTKTSCHGIAGKCLGTGLSPSTAKGNRTRKEIIPQDVPVRACEGSSLEECDAPCPGKPFII